ncbi:homoserine dehydrogenase [Abyssisolibacter fermentans]|uniref:homoserine dehydrogenase n=1 Tax=Abyssisolibacter fermentans TaxID=1766203 RepID=UPI00082BE98C|nr:homoserine dehydrogenase [Abyssisolibacter fermentans]
MIKIGLLGFGTVGSGVYEIITTNENFKKSMKDKVMISKILVRDKNKDRNIKFPQNILTENADDILNDPEIDIVVAVMGGINPSYQYIIKAFENGKHVVTANKAVVSKYYDTFLTTAKKNNRAFLFEASVGGGIPVIKPLKQSVKINDVDKIKGILNGTTNFILTKMTEESYSFEDALKLAQELGYAEADPTDDIQGYDIARKLSILSNIAFKSTTSVENIKCRGISDISKCDIEKFDELGKKVKLVGSAIKIEDEYSASVEPLLVDKNSTLGTVNDAFNIVSVSGNTVGELQFFGQGAGKNPTANAVVCDIIDVINGEYENFDNDNKKVIDSAGAKLFEGSYYLRITPENKQQIPNLIDFLLNKALKFKICEQDENLIIITEAIRADKMENLVELLNTEHKNYCYARFDDNKILA